VTRGGGGFFKNLSRTLGFDKSTRATQFLSRTLGYSSTQDFVVLDTSRRLRSVWTEPDPGGPEAMDLRIKSTTTLGRDNNLLDQK